MRLIQEFDASHEREFMALEKKFAELEAIRPDYPKGKRMQPISGNESCNTLIWECVFPYLKSAYEAMDFFARDAAHEKLFQEVLPYFVRVKIEFYKNLEF